MYRKGTGDLDRITDYESNISVTTGAVLGPGLVAGTEQRGSGKR